MSEQNFKNKTEPFYDVRVEVEENNFFMYKFCNTLEEAKQTFELISQFIPEDESPTKITLVRFNSSKTGIGIKETVLKEYKLRDQEGKIVKLSKKQKQELILERYQELRDKLQNN